MSPKFSIPPDAQARINMLHKPSPKASENTDERSKQDKKTHSRSDDSDEADTKHESAR